MDKLLEGLASYGPIGVVCGLMAIAISALWKRVVSMQGENLAIAREAIATMTKFSEQLERLLDGEKK